MSQRRSWQDWELEILCSQYADTPTKALSESIQRSVAAIYGRATILGLRKSEAYPASPVLSCFWSHLWRGVLPGR